MKQPIYSYKEYTTTKINGKQMNISIEGEVFDENIIEKSLEPLYTRITFKSIDTDKNINQLYFREAFSKDELEAEIKNTAKHIKKFIDGHN